jgi:hypothetical protein
VGSRGSIAIACLFFAGALAASGCGRGGAHDAVKQTAERFYHAVQARDGSAACELLGDETRKQLEKDEMKPCDQAVFELELQGSRADAATVTETSAEVHLAHGDTVFLDEGPDGWQVSAAGCKPGSDQEPYDCEVES